MALFDVRPGAGDLGGTMRLGLYPAVLKEGSVVAATYGRAEVKERHRHRKQDERESDELDRHRH